MAFSTVPNPSLARLEQRILLHSEDVDVGGIAPFFPALAGDQKTEWASWTCVRDFL
jgi:hypothetical protein